MTEEQKSLLSELLSNECSCLEFILTNDVLDPEEAAELRERLELAQQTQGELNVYPPEEYETSVDFTDEFTDVDETLKSVRMTSWMRMTDANHGTRAEARLANVHLAMDDLWAELEKAE